MKHHFRILGDKKNRKDKNNVLGAINLQKDENSCLSRLHSHQPLNIQSQILLTTHFSLDTTREVKR